ncbi:hypothetical protein ACIP93_09480 [Streptomyces sp. NPDC088745]|uniref:hypothetical protein n=1 Tax=Streptomyces sp. NPDC088745 TaxID=3365884 RepID=UPI00380C8899
MDIAAQSQTRAVRGRRFPGWRETGREPFRPETWRRAGYLVLAVPVSVLCVPLAMVGGPVGRVQRALRERVLGERFGFEVREGGGAAAAAVYVLAAVPLSLAGLVVTAYWWAVVALNLGYPLRPGVDPTDAWGGPALAGAWAVHGIGGIGFLLLAPWVGKGFTALQTRLAVGLLGRDGRGRGRALGFAAGVVLVCGLLSVPVVHQL